MLYFSQGAVASSGGGDSGVTWADVVLRLTMDGSDTSTTFTDLSNSGHTVTANGNAQVTTATKKFGTGGLLLDGTGDYLSVPDHADWDIGSGAFTLDFWVKPDAWPTTAGDPVVLLDMAWDATGPMIVSFNSSSQLQIDLRGLASSQLTSGALTLSTSAFTHIRLTWGGTGTNFKAIVDGTDEVSSSQIVTLNTVGGTITIGARANGAQAFDGVIDDVIFVVGSEITYTAPPTAAAPTS